MKATLGACARGWKVKEKNNSCGHHRSQFYEHFSSPSGHFPCHTSYPDFGEVWRYWEMSQLLISPTAPIRSLDWELWTTLAERSWWDTALTQLLKPLMSVHQSTGLCRYFCLSTWGHHRDCFNYIWLGLPKLCGCSGNFIPNPFSSKILLQSFGN